MAMKTISAWEARRNFGKMMDEVARTNQTVIVESHGEPKVAIVPARLAQNWEERRARVFDLWRETAERVNMPEDEAMELANEIVAEVRAERRAQKAQQAG
jgi:prevent-host-death family protein